MKKSNFYILPNGLKVVFYQDNTKHSAFAKVIVNYGARDTDFIVNGKDYHMNDGISHFIEHLLLDHSIYGNVSEYFKDSYVNYNGNTNYKSTSFYIKTVTDFDKHLEELIKIVNTLDVTDDDIKQTKGAIYEEIRRSKDAVFNDFSIMKRKCLFKNYKYETILGEEENIDSINYYVVKLCHSTFYQPHNQVLVVAGNINIKHTLKLIKDIYSSLSKEEIKYVIPSTEEPNSVTKTDYTTTGNVDNNFIELVYKVNINNLSPYERVRLTFYISYFLDYNFDETSDTYRRIVDEAISVSNIGYSYSFVNDFLIISLNTYTNEFSKFTDLVNGKMINRCYDIEFFEIRKKREIIDFILREESFMKVTNLFLENVVSFDYYEIDKLEDIENQNFDEFKKEIDSLDFSNYTVMKMLKNDKN